MTSQYRGVSWNGSKQTWRVVVQVNRQKFYLGHYEYEEEAALAYNEKVKLLGCSPKRFNKVPPNVKTRDPVLILSEEERLLLAGYGDDLWNSLL